MEMEMEAIKEDAMNNVNLREREFFLGGEESINGRRWEGIEVRASIGSCDMPALLVIEAVMQLFFHHNVLPMLLYSSNEELRNSSSDFWCAVLSSRKEKAFPELGSCNLLQSFLNNELNSLVELAAEKGCYGFEHQILRAIFSFEIRVQNDILKRLYHTEDAPQDMMEMRAEIVAMLKSLSLHPYVQELKANKEELRVEKLKDKGRLEKALVEEEGKGKGLRCFGGITAVFSNFGSGCGSLGNVKADEKCKTKAIGVEGIGFYTHQIKECKENFINEVHQNLKVSLFAFVLISIF
ncbi:hypothetical protein AHAS_Ahas03G0011700 [Arachis hypogaea]